VRGEVFGASKGFKTPQDIIPVVVVDDLLLEVCPSLWRDWLTGHPFGADLAMDGPPRGAAVKAGLLGHREAARQRP
jgi:hypothetical protein